MVVALLTWYGYKFHFLGATIGFLYLLTVMSVSILFGFWQGSATSIAAALCLDYFFYPPLLTFSITNTQDWLALGTFEISALVVSRLSSRERENYREAVRQRETMGKLYEMSRSALLLDLRQAPGPQLVQLIVRILHVDAVALFDAALGRLDAIGGWSAGEQELAKSCYIIDANHDDPGTRTYQRVLRLGTRPAGGFAIRGAIGSLAADALASLAAVAFERYLWFEKERRIETARQSEQLRTAVLDSLAHALKTPLTAISAASAGVLDAGDLSPPQLDLITLIEEETAELRELCNRLLQTAKLGTEQVSVGKDHIMVGDLISQAIAKHKDLNGREVQVSLEDLDLSIRGDRELLGTILIQYLDNALKYSFPDTPIEVTARRGRSEVVISVRNQGPTIPLEDRELIFERFYRSPDFRDRVPGTGIGLSVAREAAEAHRGHVWVISNEKEGTSFFLSIPQEGGGQR